MEKEQIIIVYGFVYDSKIRDKIDAILCKSINSSLPVYASPLIIQVADMNIIFDKIKEIERRETELLNKIDELAASRYEKASWKMVLYSNNLIFDDYIDYEMENENIN